MSDTLQLVDPNRHQRDITLRVATLFGIVIALSLVLFLRMAYLQIIEHDRYRTISEGNRIQLWPVAPRRGLIMDRNGILLADNVPVFSLTLVPELVDDMDGTLGALNGLIGLTAEEVEVFRKRLTRARRPYEPVELRTRLTDEEKARVLVEHYRLPGVQVDAKLVRHYPYTDLVAHAVGAVRRISESDLEAFGPDEQTEYAGSDYIGRLGVEKEYEAWLHGKVGHQRVEIDARGTVRQELDRVDAVAGRDLRLFLDVRLQQAAVAALEGRRGVVVAIEPATGGILAMVSQPGYDPNPFVTGISSRDYRALQDHPDNPLFNRVTHGQSSPGSTFKPFVGLAALRSGTTSWDRRILDPGYFRLPGSRRLYRDWSWRRGGGGGHGQVNLPKAIYRSSNVYFFSVSHEMGIDRMSAFISQFGFGRDGAFDVADAATGVLPTPAWKRKRFKQPWYPGDTINVGIGQGFLLVTPMQLATAVTVLANRGRFVPSRMLMEADGSTADLDLPRPTQIGGISRADWENMVWSMEQVVHRHAMGWDEEGTAYSAIGKRIPYLMAGKSGTAQVVEIKQGRTYNAGELQERHRKHAWFIAFAPADAPKIAVVVLVENGGGGSAVAAPVARDVIDAYLLPTQVAAR